MHILIWDDKAMCYNYLLMVIAIAVVVVIHFFFLILLDESIDDVVFAFVKKRR